MEYIRAKEYETTIDIYFDGEKYVFINRVVDSTTKVGNFEQITTSLHYCGNPQGC